MSKCLWLDERAPHTKENRQTDKQQNKCWMKMSWNKWRRFHFFNSIYFVQASGAWNQTTCKKCCGKIYKKKKKVQTYEWVRSTKYTINKKRKGEYVNSLRWEIKWQFFLKKSKSQLNFIYVINLLQTLPYFKEKFKLYLI